VYQMEESLGNGIHGFVPQLDTNVPLCGTSLGRVQVLQYR
jgi:hypothetical protein